MTKENEKIKLKTKVLAGEEIDIYLGSLATFLLDIFEGNSKPRVKDNGKRKKL